MPLRTVGDISRQKIGDKMNYVVGLIGIWLVQDSLASIMFYPTEKWQWNHLVRLIRAVMGVALIVIGAIS